MANQNIYPASSPYHLTNVVDNKFLDVVNYRTIPHKADDVYMEITPAYEFRPDLLAYDLYGNSRLWWVFAARNPNRLGADPLFNFEAGVGIYIPTHATLISALGI